jgi:hypothetical protein
MHKNWEAVEVAGTTKWCHVKYRPKNLVVLVV